MSSAEVCGALNWPSSARDVRRLGEAAQASSKCLFPSRYLNHGTKDSLHGERKTVVYISDSFAKKTTRMFLAENISSFGPKFDVIVRC